MITSINKRSYPNTLIVILEQDDGENNYQEKGDIVRITNKKGQTIGFNFFNIDKIIDYANLPDGQVKLSKDELDKLNRELKAAGFSEELAYGDPTLVYGYVESCQSHPDSDHLHITQVNVGKDKYQIVCGAPNIEKGQKVVVALPGTLMPNGQQIWPGELRGEDSYGMICSARELGLKNAPQKRGIMVVPDDFEIGREFEADKCDELLAQGVISL